VFGGINMPLVLQHSVGLCHHWQWSGCGVGSSGSRAAWL